MPDDRPLSPAAAARYIQSEWHLKVHPETVRRWIRKGGLPATKTPSGYLLIEKAALHDIFDAPTAADRND
jgi:excisionase family DNA binding protein